jgi:hypothetical protein
MAALAAALGAGGCGRDMSGAQGAGERAVYCYQALVGIDCYPTPNHLDERRLVSYTGPAPETYPKPLPPPEPQLYAPANVSYWVKDPEPVPTAAPAARQVQRQPFRPRAVRIFRPRLDTQSAGRLYAARLFRRNSGAE